MYSGEDIFEKIDSSDSFQTENSILNVDEAADFMRCSRASVYNRVRNGTIPYIRNGGRVVFWKPDIIDWMKQNSCGLVRNKETGLFEKTVLK